MRHALGQDLGEWISYATGANDHGEMLALRPDSQSQTRSGLGDPTYQTMRVRQLVIGRPPDHRLTSLSSPSGVEGEVPVGPVDQDMVSPAKRPVLRVPAAGGAPRALGSLGVTSSPRHRPGVAPRGMGEGFGEGGFLVDADAAIGERARLIRRRRGLSLDAAAGLAGISKSHLSRLETGKRGFQRRGLLDDLAVALGCAVADLTDQPYRPLDRATAEALGCLPAISVALHDASLTDAPDAPARPVAELAALAHEANRHTDETRYALAGRHLGAVLSELHTYAVADIGDREVALTALVVACIAASGMARPLGRAELSAAATQRGYDAARCLGDPALIGFATMQHASSLTKIGAAHRASVVRMEALAELGETDPSASDTRPAEAEAALCLGIGALAARSGRTGDVDHYFTRAAELAERTGARETLRFHLSPAQVRAWRLSAAVEYGDGPGAAERIDSPELFAGLASATRTGRAHLDFARAYVQAEGARDAEAVRHLDAADRIAASRVRHDPMARELVVTLHRRARRRVWELDSLMNRFGIN